MIDRIRLALTEFYPENEGDQNSPESPEEDEPTTREQSSAGEDQSSSSKDQQQDGLAVDDKPPEPRYSLARAKVILSELPDDLTEAKVADLQRVCRALGVPKGGKCKIHSPPVCLQRLCEHLVFPK